MSVTKISIIVCLLLQIGCATTTKDKIIQNTLLATAVGAAIGAGKAEHREANTLLYASTAGLTAAIASVFYYDPDKELSELRKTTNRLRDEMDEFENGYKTKRSTSSISHGPAMNGMEKLPEEYRRMINPGQWSLFEIDQWVEGGEGRMIHQDKMLEIKPASIKSR